MSADAILLSKYKKNRPEKSFREVVSTREVYGGKWRISQAQNFSGALRNTRKSSRELCGTVSGPEKFSGLLRNGRQPRELRTQVSCFWISMMNNKVNVVRNAKFCSSCNYLSHSFLHKTNGGSSQPVKPVPGRPRRPGQFVGVGKSPNEREDFSSPEFFSCPFRIFPTSTSPLPKLLLRLQISENWSSARRPLTFFHRPWNKLWLLNPTNIATLPNSHIKI